MVVDMWSKVIGHERQIEQLKAALASGRMPGAYLFSGPSGIGKRLVADAFASAALCERAGEEACGECAACRKASSGNHPDLFVLAPELSERGTVQNIRIDSVRDLQSALRFAPLEGARKIAIIDGADRLMEAAANSLLKTLEEPPPSTHFILISPYPMRLLATIRSRCRHLPFSPLPEEELAREIVRMHSIDEEDALRIARLSGGSMGTASLLDPEFVDSILGRFLPLASRASSADIIETAQVWKEIGIERTPLIFDLMASWYRDLLRCRATGRSERLIHRESAAKAACASDHLILRNLANIEKARATAETSANKQLMFEQLLFSLAPQQSS